MTMDRPKVHAVVGSAVGPRELLPAAQAAEAAGFTDVWVAEDYFLTGSMSAAGMILAGTDRVRVTTGVTAMFARHPALLAMEASTLGNAFEGRFRLGVGTGGVLWMRQLGLDASATSVRRFRKSVEVLRELLSGRTVSSDELDVRAHEIALHYPAPDLPIVIGPMGPRMLGIADDLADAVVLSILAGPEYVRWATGKLPRVQDVTTFAVFNVDDDGDRARNAVRARLAFSLQRGPSPLTDHAGISEELAGFLATRGQRALTEQMPDRWVRAMSVSGTPAECVTRIEELLAAGSQSVGLFPIPGEDAIGILTRAGLDILPRLT